MHIKIAFLMTQLFKSKKKNIYLKYLFWTSSPFTYIHPSMMLSTLYIL